MRRRAGRRRALLAGGGAVLAGALLSVLLVDEDEAPRRAPRAPLPVAKRVERVERPRLAPPIARPPERPQPVTPPAATHVATKASPVAIAPATVDVAPLARGTTAPGLEARASRAERRLLALEKREAVARRFAQARRELGLEEDGPEARSLRILLGDDSPFRRSD